MKKRIFHISAAAVTVIFAACEKNEIRLAEFTDQSDKAQVKVNVFSHYRSNPSVQIKVNGERVSNALTAATPFPGGGLNTGGGSTADYLAVSPGSAKVAIGMPRAGTNTDSILINEASVNLSAGVKYSLYFADTAANTTSLLVIDSLNRPDSGFVRYKFINLIPDLPSADLYIGTVRVASGIAYKGVSPSFVLPTNNSSTTWAIRAAGGTTNLATYASASTLANQRVFTVVARGYNSILNTTTDPRRRIVSLIYNE